MFINKSVCDGNHALFVYYEMAFAFLVVTEYCYSSEIKVFN